MTTYKSAFQPTLLSAQATAAVRAMLDKLRSEHSKRAAYHVPEENLNNADGIAARVEAVPPEAQSALRTTLSYLYLSNGPLNLRNPAFLIAQGYLTPCEVILARYLKSRTGGVGRKVYGKEALFQMRKAGYKCECCGNGDVRTLHLDHVHGRAQKVFFVLCANCHNIKSRLFDWSGAKKFVDGA